MLSRESIGQAGKWPTSPKGKPDNANWLCARKKNSWLAVTTLHRVKQLMTPEESTHAQSLGRVLLFATPWLLCP